MDVLYERCVGLDVHRDTVVACLLTPEGRQLRTFGTMTDDLLALADWLIGQRVSHVAMESTGVYWKPVYNLLEGSGLELLVVNARHIKAVPGRKTDVRDAEWIADLLRHGLLRGSFIPDRAQRELRELVRYRKRLIEERGREAPAPPQDPGGRQRQARRGRQRHPGRLGSRDAQRARRRPRRS
jgi:transposase